MMYNFLNWNNHRLIMQILFESQLYKLRGEKWTVHWTDCKFIFIWVSETQWGWITLRFKNYCKHYIFWAWNCIMDKHTPTKRVQRTPLVSCKKKMILHLRNYLYDLVLLQQSAWHCMNHQEEFWFHCQIAELHFLIICFLEKGPQKLWYHFKSY